MLVLEHRAIASQHRIDPAGGLDQQQTKLEFIDAQHQNGVVKLACHSQRPPPVARSIDFFQSRWLCSFRPAQGECRGSGAAIQGNLNMLIAIPRIIDGSFERIEFDTVPVSHARRFCNQLFRP